tara:strand:- start:388 stop:522 length:135 start_codon:yes stop_codon:yes gene_type:complete
MQGRTHLIRRAMEGKLVSEDTNIMKFQARNGMKITVSKKRKENK